MKRICELLNTIVFFGIIVLFFAASLFLPKEDFSETENRYLAKKPSFDVDSWFSGEFMDKAGEYIDDSFPLRLNWISLHTRLELLSGKRSVNGVYIADERMLELCPPVDIGDIEASLEALRLFSEKTEAQVYLLIAPTAAEIYSQSIYTSEEVLNQRSLIESVYDQLGGRIKTIPVYNRLKGLKNEYIYYRTDHHWTQKGAYYAYLEAARVMGISPLGIEHYNIMHADHGFTGSLHSKTLYDDFTPDTIDFYICISDKVRLVTDDERSSGSPYVTDHLSSKDKYLAYLGKNMPLVSLHSQLGNGKLLIIKDSYANCFAPFMAPHFETVDIIDLRYIIDPNDYININDYDSVLILYNAANFSTDRNLSKLRLIK